MSAEQGSRRLINRQSLFSLYLPAMALALGTGIATPAIPQPNSVIASFDVVAASRAGLEVALKEAFKTGPK